MEAFHNLYARIKGLDVVITVEVEMYKALPITGQTCGMKTVFLKAINVSTGISEVLKVEASEEVELVLHNLYTDEYLKTSGMHHLKALLFGHKRQPVSLKYGKIVDQRKTLM